MTLSLKSKSSGVPVISCVAGRNKRAGPRAWAGLALLSLPTVMLGLDLTLLHLTLPALALDLSRPALKRSGSWMHTVSLSQAS